MPDRSDFDYQLSAIKRKWVPEKLYKAFSHHGFFKNWAAHQPLKFIFHREVDEFTDRRINGAKK